MFSCMQLYDYNLQDPLLPNYTESGRDIAAARVSDNVWLVEKKLCTGFSSTACNDDFFKIYSFPDRVSFVLFGTISGLINGFDKAAIIFEIQNESIEHFSSFVRFSMGENSVGNDFEIILKLFSSTDSTMTVDYNAQFGRMEIKKIEAIRYEDRNRTPIAYILSGTFGFDVVDELGNDIGVHYGRFDFRFEQGMLISRDSVYFDF